MARFLSQALLRPSATNTTASLHSLLRSTVSVPSCVTIAHRHRSSQPSKAQLLETDPSSSTSSPSADSEYELALKRFDDLIQRILVQKATPDWLPFVPGSSFWVPPLPTPSKVFDLVEKLTDEGSDEEALSVSNFRGWPCSEFFLKGLVDADIEVNGPEEMELLRIFSVATKAYC
ncbi:hypothetical protein L6164_014015 [Bauhinia variegata]|uniref:Uncharacterized protein n=1 Tax=Bauhinia variegata TaxID=167791 RepID=A0ACB9NG26_BAUVA|nr:hypothetical protein L6164_014015 [Bauhinia variegata]